MRLRSRGLDTSGHTPTNQRKRGLSFSQITCCKLLEGTFETLTPAQTSISRQRKLTVREGITQLCRLLFNRVSDILLQ